jgi:AraC-like DNA-binding protein
MEQLDDLRRLISRHCGGGRVQTPIPRLALVRSDTTSTPTRGVYEPMLCIIVQGRKRVMVADKLFEYDAAKYLIASVALPMSGEICEASPRAPYLALSLTLDPVMLAAMLIETPGCVDTGEPAAGLAISPMEADLFDPVARLLRLLDRPGDIAMLAPLAECEIVYRLLQGEQGRMLRQIALADSRLSKISRAIGWIRGNYAEPLRIETLARVAGMSPSSLHRHFKSITNMSPLQFQKQIRLQEARRLLLARRTDACRVGFAVGYESTSQFSREYNRLFGSPPARDAARLRGTPAAPYLTHPL